MSRTTQLNWNVPEPEWDLTLSYVGEEYELEPFYVRLVVESAMKEWIDLDEYAATEDLADHLGEVCPYSLSRFSQTQYSISDGEDSDVDMVLVTTSINTDLVDKFRKVTREKTEYRLGIALVHALWHYRHGGRSQRIDDKLQRLIDAETGETSDYDPVEQDIHYMDVDLDRLDGRTRKKNVYKIAQRLNPGPKDVLHRDHELRETIEDVAGKSVVDVYVEAVVDVLNFKEHPTNPVLFVHESWEPETDALGEAATPTDGEPAAVDRKSFDDMTKDERLESIRLQLARKAKRMDRHLLQVDYNFIRRKVFDRQTSAGYANNIMADAADAPGFEYVTKEGGKRLKVNLGKIDNDLRNMLLPDSGPDDSEPEPEPEPEPEEQEDELRDEISEEWDTLNAATPEHELRADGCGETQDMQ